MLAVSFIQVRNVKKVYQETDVPITALQNINLEITQQKLVSFIGPSGSGKSTLLNLLGCLDKPTGGEIIIKGEQVTEFSRIEAARFRAANISFVFQQFNLLPVLTTYENVEYPLVMVQSLSLTERKQRVLELLEEVGMTDQKNKYPRQLSGGQQQRVAIARALVTRPKLVLADEPTANLDSRTAQLIIQLMKKMKAEWQTTFLFATHDPKVVQEVEELYRIEDGGITKINQETMP